MHRVSKIGMVVFGGLLAVIVQANAADQFTLMFGQRTATASEARSYFIPKHLGFFKEENLEVTLQPTDGATQEMQLLAAGQGDAGLGAPPAILLARNSGANVRAIYNSVRNHGTALAVLADGPIKDPKELKGKKVGVMSMGASRTLDGYAMAQAAGLDPKKDVEWLPVGFGVQAALALKRGDVQALALWDLTYADMEANGIPLRYFTFPFQENIFGYVYVSTDEKLKTRRADIIKVLRAGAKAQVFQAANMDAAACAYLIEFGPVGHRGGQAKGVRGGARGREAGHIALPGAGAGQHRYVPAGQLGEGARLLSQPRRDQGQAGARGLFRHRPEVLRGGQRFRPRQDRGDGEELSEQVQIARWIN